jgi:LmbE family N-acetylglucosaminyl deacetylase
MNLTLDPLHPKIALCIGAHPDDIDFMAGGTVATWAQAGTAVYYLILTDGSSGSDDRSMTPDNLIHIRQQEQRKAGQVLGIKDVFFLSNPDGQLQNTLDVRRDIVRYIRKVRPDVVVTLDPTVVYIAEMGLINHPDHRAGGQAALDAVYPLARDHMAFPELLSEGLQPHNTPTVLLANWATKNYGVDITDVFDRKIDCLNAHPSQNLNTDVATKLASQDGQACGTTYAETFVRLDVDRF